MKVRQIKTEKLIARFAKYRRLGEIDFHWIFAPIGQKPEPFHDGPYFDYGDGEYSIVEIFYVSGTLRVVKKKEKGNFITCDWQER